MRSKRDPDSVANRAFIANGAATYVPLAMGLLLAVLFGLPDDAGDFTDEADG
ncbi:hypothetical protein D9M72_629490 [compost metagenome]